MVKGLARRHSTLARWIARATGKEEEKIRNKVELWERLVLTSAALALATCGARSWPVLEGIETWWLDRMASFDRPRFREPIAVVGISDRDFYDPSLFGGVSPLDPNALHRILRTVMDHHPRGVILDVQIHPAASESLERLRARSKLYRMIDSTAAASGAPIVLVRDLDAERKELAKENPLLVEWNALASSDNPTWADPTIVRTGEYVRYLPRYNEDETGKPLPTPTVLGAAASAFGLPSLQTVPFWIVGDEFPMTPWRVRFSGHFLDDSASVGPYHTDAGVLLSRPVVAGQRTILTDRIVLVGGTYFAGRDFHQTAVGRMAGVHVWAEAIASWIRQDAIRTPRESITFALEFLIGVMTGSILVASGPGIGLILCLLVVSPMAVLASLLTFGDRVLFVSFLPVFVGVYLHYEIEIYVLIRRLKKRLRGAGLPDD